MKTFLSLLIVLLITTSAKAQNDVTKFLGIPVDGTKSEMIQKLKAKGFRPTTHDPKVLEGEFNGSKVHLFIGTNGNKVCRIMVSDVNTIDARSIQIRFNSLCQQFENNPKYISFNKYRIPDDENISYEMLVNNKRYEASFYQMPIDTSDSAALDEYVRSMLYSKCTQEELESMTEDSLDNLKLELAKTLINSALKRPVWFIISEMHGKYYISIYYDNEYNRANGEDL